MKRLLAAAVLSALSCFSVFASEGAPSLVPLPASAAFRPGAFTLDARTGLVADAPFQKERAYAARQIRRAAGFEPAAGPGASGTIRFRLADGLGAEAYRLTVGEREVLIEASAPAGAFYGFQTFLQLLPPEIYSNYPREGIAWKARAVRVEDAPRFGWRGAMIDEGRHFIGTDGVREMLDAMAAHKLNVLHWHLTDDQGWRIQIRRYPQLTEKGAFRRYSPGYKGNDGQPYGPYYYTQEQIRDLVAYAAERHITIVPEIDVPGHSTAALAALPELSCRPGAVKEPLHRWGISWDLYCAGNPQTFVVLKHIFDEVMELFPSAYIHCGGDEAPKDRWNACPKCRAKIKELGLKNSHDLQSWFIGEIARYLEAKGRHLIGWDEILQRGLPPKVAIMGWHPGGGIRAANEGRPAVMTPNSYLYFNFPQGVDDDPYLAYNRNHLSLRHVYNYDPEIRVAPDKRKFVLGLQGNLWGEKIYDSRSLQWFAWPRLAAVGEIGWTPQAARAYDGFRARMALDAERLRAMGIHAAPFSDEPCAGWKAGEAPAKGWAAREWDVTGQFPRPGNYNVTIRHASGNPTAAVRNITLLVDGAPAAQEEKESSVGYDSRNFRMFALKSRKPGAKIVLRMEISGKGSGNAAGDVYVVREADGR